MEKSAGEIRLEKILPFGKKGPYTIEKRKIISNKYNTEVPIGETVTVRNWGTFGCWDTNNRWVSFYDSKPAGMIRNWNQ